MLTKGQDWTVSRLNCKCNVRRDTISYTFHKKQTTPRNFEILEHNLEKIVNQKIEGTDTEEIDQQIDECRRQIDTIIATETQGSTLGVEHNAMKRGKKVNIFS